MTRAFSPFLPGHTSAQLPQPRQSRTSTACTKRIPVNVLPIAGIVPSALKGAAAISFSSRTKGRIAAWGQTYAHLLHWIQFSSTHSGTNVATPRFSNLAVDCCHVPSARSLKSETLRRSPSCALMGRTMSRMNAGSLFAFSSSAGRLLHAGSTVSCAYSPPRSTAA